MGRFRLFAVAAAAATVAGLMGPAAVKAAPATPPHHPARPVVAITHSRPTIQWLPSTDGKVSGLVHYPSGLTTRVSQRPAVKAKAKAEPSRPRLRPADVPAADRARVSGRVVDTAHHPLADVEVDAYAGGFDEPFAATTDANGHYVLVLAPGNYFFRIDGGPGSGGNSDATGYVGTGAEIQLAAGQHLIRNAKLQPGAKLTVRATDRDGRPLAGVGPYLRPVTPYVQSATGGGSIDDYSVSTEVQTGTDGRFTFRGLPADASFVCFSASGRSISGGAHDPEGYVNRCTGHPVAPAPHSSAVFPTVRLASAGGGELRGIVTGLGGRPLADAYVDLDSRRFFGGETVTAADGSFEMVGIQPGAYRVCAAADSTPESPRYGYAARCLRAKVDVRRDRIATADVQLHRGGAVSGTVTGPGGSPVEGAAVLAKGAHEQLALAITDGQGRYRLTGLPTGRYRVCVFATNAIDPDSPTGDQSRCYQGRKRVPVQLLSTTTGVDVQLIEGGAIAGRVVNGDGVGIRNVAVEVFAPSGEGASADGTTDANGDYRITGLPAGRYEACFYEFDGDLAGTCPPGEVAVRIGQHTELDQTLGASGPHGSIAISVRDEQGRPVQAVDTAVLEPCGDGECDSPPLFGHHGRTGIVDSEVVDNAGRVLSDGLKPGKYAVCLFAYYGLTRDGAPPGGYTDRCAGRGFTVTVRAGATTRVHLTLHPGGRVIGRITDSSGHPVAHAQVKVSHSAATDYNDIFARFGHVERPSPLADSLTRTDGTYAISGVRPGVQRICVQAPRGGEYLRGCAERKVRVSAAATTHAPDLALRRAGAVSGVVRNAAGHPVPDVIVDVLTSVRHAAGFAFGSQRNPGHYRVGKLPAGHYVVCFVAYRYDPQCYSQVPWNVKGPRLPKDAIRVAVRPGRTTTHINAVLHRSK